MMSKPSGMWHMVFWMFGVAGVIAMVMIGTLLFDQIPVEDLFRNFFDGAYFVGVILGGGVVMGLYFGVIIGVPLGIISDLLVETKNRQITAESINQRQYFVYGLALVLVFGLAMLLMALPPITEFDFILVTEPVVAGILAVLMLIAVYRYLNRLSVWVTSQATVGDAPKEKASGSVSLAEPVEKPKKRKGELPPLVLKTDDDSNNS